MMFKPKTELEHSVDLLRQFSDSIQKTAQALNTTAGALEISMNSLASSAGNRRVPRRKLDYSEQMKY
jgi:hypothetical protein